MLWLSHNAFCAILNAPPEQIFAWQVSHATPALNQTVRDAVLILNGARLSRA
jgi:hypothetical protein